MMMPLPAAIIAIWGPFCGPVHPTRVAPCASVVDGGGALPGTAHGGVGVAGHGPGWGNGGLKSTIGC